MGVFSVTAAAVGVSVSVSVVSVVFVGDTRTESGDGFQLSALPCELGSLRVAADASKTGEGVHTSLDRNVSSSSTSIVGAGGDR